MAGIRQPGKCTVMHRKHLVLGATMIDYHGWQVARQFASPDEEAQRVRKGVGLADVSWLAKLDVQGKDVNLKSQIPDSRPVWRLAKDHWMVLCEPDAKDTVTQEMQMAASRYPCLHVTDMTSVYVAFLLAGSHSRDALNRLTALDVSGEAMPNLSCAQAGLADVHAMILREDIGEVVSYRLLVGREYGEYFWDTLMHAGQEFGIVPFGLIAQRLLSH